MRDSLFIFFISVVVYWNTLYCGFVFDDASAIKGNNDLRPNLTNISDLFHHDFWGTLITKEKSHKSYRPLCVLTFRLNYVISHLNPSSYHLVNVVLHGLISCLFFELCKIVFEDDLQYYSYKHHNAILSTMLFVVHPVHTEAVASIVGRAELLSAFFMLLAYLNYTRVISHQKNLTKFFHFVFTLILTLISVLCKEQGIMVLPLCICYEIVSQKATVSILFFDIKCSLIQMKKVPKWLLLSTFRSIILLSYGFVLLYGRVFLMGNELPVFTKFDNPSAAAATPARQLTFSFLVPVNLWLLVSPAFLCCDWTMGSIPLITSIFDWRNIYTLITCVIFILAFYLLLITRSIHFSRILLVGLSWLILPWLPASNLFFYVGFVVAERVLYTPSMGYCILFIGVIKYLYLSSVNYKVLRAFTYFSLIFLITVFTFKTVHRNRDWMSEMSLFKSAVLFNKNNAKLYNNIGHAYEGDGNFSEALKYFQHAANIQPDDIGAHNNIGRTYRALGKLKLAEKSYIKAISLFPRAEKGDRKSTAHIAPQDLNVYLNFGNLLAINSSRLLEADKWYHTLIKMRPDFTDAYINRADVLLKLGHVESARNHYEIAHKLDPLNPDILYNLGIVELTVNKNENNAVKYFKKALQMKFDHIQSLFNLAMLYVDSDSLKDHMKAKELFHHITEIDPSHPQVWSELGMLYLYENNYESAVNCFAKMLQINSTHRSTLFNIAVVLHSHLKRSSESLSYLKTLVKNHPDHIKGLLLLGELQINFVFSYSEAVQSFRKILVLQPSSMQARHNLCVALIHLKNVEEAKKCIKDIENVINKYPQSGYSSHFITILKKLLVNI